MFELVDGYNTNAVIKVIGVGGGGGNAVSHMMDCGIDGVEFICANTDSQALKNARVKTAIQIGCNITKGLGAGANPDLGRQAAMEDRDRICEAIEGSDMLFITAGMGGGTGTGAAPIVAQVARELGILTVAVVTKPFGMEGKKRHGHRRVRHHRAAKYVDSLITIPNQKLLTVLGKQTTLLDAFKSANQVLQGAVQGIAELITRPGLINVDFADVRTVMSEMGMAMMGTGRGTGEDRAREAAEAAISSPLLEDINLEGAKGILVNVTAGMDLSIGEFDEVGNAVKERASTTPRWCSAPSSTRPWRARSASRWWRRASAVGLRAPAPAALKVCQRHPPGAARQWAGPVNYNDLEAPPTARPPGRGG
jgi:cell division protein FtsZ